MNPSYSESAEHLNDELILEGPVKTRTVTITDNQSVGALSRGTVLGWNGTVYGIVHQTGGFGTLSARAVLAEDCDPTGADVDALVYEMADVNEDKLILGGTVTLAQVREPLRALGLFLKKPVSA